MTLESLRAILKNLDYPRAIDSVESELSAGIEISRIFDEAVFPVLTEFETMYEKHKQNLPMLMRMNQMVKDLVKDTGYELPKLGKAIVATTDSHTWGRDLIGSYLAIRGFDVVIVDERTSFGGIVGFCMDPEVTVCCISGVYATAEHSAVEVGRLLTEAGIRDRLIFNAGGMAMSAEAASKAGCDVFSPSGAEAVDTIVSAVKNLKNRFRSIWANASNRVSPA